MPWCACSQEYQEMLAVFIRAISWHVCRFAKYNTFNLISDVCKKPCFVLEYYKLYCKLYCIQIMCIELLASSSHWKSLLPKPSTAIGCRNFLFKSIKNKNKSLTMTPTTSSYCCVRLLHRSLSLLYREIEWKYVRTLSKSTGKCSEKKKGSNIHSTYVPDRRSGPEWYVQN